MQKKKKKMEQDKRKDRLVLNSVVRVALLTRGHLSKDLKEIEELAVRIYGGVFQIEGSTFANALRKECILE